MKLLVASIAICLSAAFCLPALAGVEQFNGRWNITVENELRGRAWWLQVEGAGTSGMRGKFVGAPGGGLYDIPKIGTEGGELVFIFNDRNYYRRPGEDPKTKRKDIAIYRCRLSGPDRIEGTFVVEGRPGPPVKWSGKRAPVINEKDDGSWKPGAPIELFNGKNLDGWHTGADKRKMTWTASKGILVNDPPSADIQTRQKFWNFQLHVEYRIGPKSNSGIGLRGRYEVQIMDDFGRPPDLHNTGALYSRILPRTNASKAPGEWQTLDIRLVGRIVTVKHNGVTLIEKGEIEGATAMSQDPHEDQPGPIMLQGDHGKVEFRKITLSPLVK